MSGKQSQNPMRIRIDGERRERTAHSTRRFFSNELDVELSDFQAERIVDFFVRELGAPVYNQAIRDAHGFLTDKLSDLEGEFYEPEEAYSR